jgi:hypothetical protein
MAENISSNVLFHFTKSMDDLKSILKHGFYPHYCPEYTFGSGDSEAISKRHHPMCAVPIVSFCDLPLSLIRKHLKAYGRYGIGLKKTWGVSKGVAPVIYTHSKALTRKSISRLTARIANINDTKALSDLERLTAYTKPFVGSAWRTNHVKMNVRFYDEREWRYVPVVRGSRSLFLDWKDYRNAATRNRLQSRFKKENTLSVDPDAIQYLIVPYDKGETNVIKLHNYLKTLYSQKDTIWVTTAIMTDNCIQEDV